MTDNDCRLLRLIYNKYQNGDINRCKAIKKLVEYIDNKRGEPDFEQFVKAAAEVMLRMFAQG